MFQFVENNNIMLIEQYLLLLSGGAGVGKILLLKVIKYHKRVKKYCGWNLDQPSVLVIASMMKAAN